jgi:neutral ceramidase
MNTELTDGRVLAAFGARDITPQIGYGRFEPEGSKTKIVGVHSNLYARLAIFDDGSSRLAIVALDLGTLAPWWADELRQDIAESTGALPVSVLISCTHTHSSPLGGVVFGSPPDDEYLRGVKQTIIELCVDTGSRLEPVQLSVSSCVTEELVFNRRPMYTGHEVGTQGLTQSDDFIKMESPADPLLQVVEAHRPDGSIAGGLVNFACHPHIMGVEPVHSADFAGAVAQEMDTRTGGTYLYLQGAAGDLAWQDLSKPVDWWPERWGPQPGDRKTPWGLDESAPWNPVARVARMGEEIADYICEARADKQMIAAVPIRTSMQTLALPHRTPSNEAVDLAYWLLRQDERDYDRYNLAATGHAYTFRDNAFLQEAFARDTIGMAALHLLGGPGASVAHARVTTLSLGQIALVGYPGEMFSAFGIATRERSPFAHTLVCGLANGNFGYVPTEDAFEHGGYETRLAMTSKLHPQSGSQMVDVAIDMLDNLHE